MHRNTLTAPRIMMVLVLIAASPAIGGAEGWNTHAKGGTIWDTAMVDGSMIVGEHISIAVDSATGKTYIAYYDVYDGDLWLAREVGSGGNCGPSNSFKCHLVDSDGNVGQYNSIDVHTDTTSAQVHISYHDVDASALKHARVSILSSGLVFTQIRTITSGIMGVIRGRHTSLKLDSSNTPHIAYQSDVALGNETLLLASYLGDGSGNCGLGDIEGDWQCESIYSAEDTGQFTSLAFNPTGKPRIAFFDELTGCPKVASFNGSMWLVSTVSQAGKTCGEYISLYVDGAGMNHIAYYNRTDEALEYAHPTTNGNCGGGAWQCDEIEDVGPNLSDLAIVEDENGYPMIAYQSTANGTALKLARPNAALGAADGNCGGIFPYYSWTCSLIDLAQSGNWVASDLDLAIGETGGAAITYLRSNIYTSTLNVAFEDGFSVFKDRLETGTTSWWSSVAQ